ncbi:MAG: TonB-dependent receptor [Ignavibacteriae bacterium]|nr:MAG: TonB-dependent receptor [Ignavibacteriota bacterium]
MRVITNFKVTALIVVLITFILSPALIISQTTGSIGGIVLDAKDNTPVVGAIVKIEGVQKGAETDDNGAYVILNVEVGTYDVTASFTGYTKQTVTGVKVSVDQKGAANFNLPPTGYTLDTTIEVVGKRRGIEVEQSGRQIDEQQLGRTPIRGIQNIVAKTAGVVQDEKGTAINIRGGRTSENLILVDGVSTTNPQDGSSSAYVSNSQLKEIQVLTGGFGAEYGNALSGVINVTTKSGSEVYSGSAEVISDFFMKGMGDGFLSTNTQGYNLYNVSFGGPLIPTKKLAKFINFYGGAERQWLLNSQPSWIADKLFTDGVIPNFSSHLWTYNGRISFNFTELNKKIPVQFKAGINYTDNYTPSFIASFLKYNSDRFRYNTNKDMQIYGRVIHNISSKFFYELQGNYYRTKGEFGDPVFKDDYFKIGDTSYIPGLRTMGGELPPEPTGVFRVSGTPYNFFQRTDVSYIGGKLDATLALLTKKMGNHELKFGGEMRYHDLKKMVFYTPSIAQSNDIRREYIDSIKALPDQTLWNKFVESQRDLWYSGSGARLKGYGYSIQDQFGNDIVTGEDIEAKHPIVGAFYLRDKVDFKDFSFNGGIRIDYLDVNSEVLKDIHNLTGADQKLLTDDDYEKSKPTIVVSPRLGFSFPITENTVFVAQFGKFIQMPPLDYLYLNRVAFSQFFKTSLQDVAENSSLKPEKLTSYEIGFKQNALDGLLNFGITAYYKETQDQIGINKVIASETVPIGYTIYMNSDFSVARGLDMYLSLRRFNRLAADVSYTLLYASGTGSEPGQKLNLVNQGTEYPNFTFPLDYDQRHTGSINLDYRFGGDEDVPKGVMGQILKNLGLNLLFSFNSGRPYTARKLPTLPFNPSSGQALSPKNAVYRNWNYSLDLKLDKTVNVWKTNWNFYIYVTNLLNSELVNRVWESTGRPDDDGYLNTPQGSIGATIPGYVENYRLRIQNPFNWGAPRQIRFGIKVNF